MKTWIGIAAAGIALFGFTVAANVIAVDGASRLAPYRYPVSPPSDSEVDALRERVARRPEAIDLAVLASACLRKAKRTGQSCWIDEAEIAARKSLETLPFSNPGATLALARAAQMKHDFERSLLLCDRVLREKPEDSGAWALKATALLAVGRMGEALSAADRLVDRLPISEHLALRAVILASQGQEREAVHDFKKAWSVEEPGDPEGSAWFRAMWARLSLQHRRLDEAEDLLREALRICPSSGLAEGLLGDLERERGDRDAAYRRYGTAYLATSDPVFLARRAALRSGPAAKELRSAAIKALREVPGHRIQLARVLLEEGTPASNAEALTLAEEEARGRRNQETLTVLAGARLSAGRLEEARQAVREALRKGAPDAPLFDLAAEIEGRLGCASRSEMYRAAAKELRS